MHQRFEKPYYSRSASSLVLGLVLGICAIGCSPARPPYPTTEKRPVTDEYYGIKVVDNYRWLDDLSNPEVRAWTDAQNRYTRATLDRIRCRPQVYDRFKEISGVNRISYFNIVQRSSLFAMKEQPPRNQPFLVALQSPEDTAGRIVIDPNQLDSTDATSIDFYVPSLDGRLVAASLSKNGSENGAAYVFDATSGKRMPDIVPRVQYPTGGGSVAWNADASGFYYTRYPHGGERPDPDTNFYQQVYFHALGTDPASDTYVIGKEFPRIAEIQLSSSDDGKFLLATVANGDGGEFEHFLRSPAGKWTQITNFTDGVSTGKFGHDRRLYLLSHHNAPRGKILAVLLDHPDLSGAKTVVPEGEAPIREFLPTATRLYVVDLVGGPSRLRAVTLDGDSQASIEGDPISTVGGLVLLAGDRVLFSRESYLEPSIWYTYEPSTAPMVTALKNTASVQYSDCEVTRDFAISKDGTKVPINIIHRKGIMLDGSNPTILYGYGGFDVSMVPYFSVRWRVWLDQGGVCAIANLRGGSEFGEEWHNAGKLTRKQNVYDDFAACAQFLIDRKYTDPAKLAIEGGSNGGLLMGAALTQHPGLFRAVVSHVGIYDMLRVERFPNGEFNVTEFGSVTDPEQFKALYAYSPYHHVVDGTAYPAVLFLTGDNDGRVDPANSRKMTARLQAATSSNLPILLRTTATAGHGFGTSLSEEFAQDADIFAFLFDQLQVEYKPMQTQL